MRTISEINKTESELENIFRNMFNLEFTESKKEYRLMDDEIMMLPRDLVYLYNEIEKKFQIAIPEQDIITEDFNTFNNILEIIKKQIIKKDCTV